LLDASGVILDYDSEFARLVGFELDQRGRTLALALPGAPSESLAEASRVMLEREDGEVELVLRRSSVGPVAHTLTARRLHSELTLAQQLRVARRTLDSVIDASPLAIVTVDQDKRVVMWNPAAEQLFGWTTEEILGRPYPIVPEQQREQFERLFTRVQGQGRGFTGVEAIRRRKDGSEIPVNMHAAPLYDATGRATGGVALFEDLTEKRQLQERSRQSQKMEAIGRLAGGIAHDFNNLLTVVLGNSELVLLEPGLSSTARARLDEIVAVARSAGELVGQLMTFSRRRNTNPQVIDVHERVRAAGRLLERLIGDAVELRVEVPEIPARVLIDPIQFDQVLVNLAVNARDAMPRGGVLQLRTEIVEREGGELLAGGRYLSLEVRDTGVGIPARVLPHIFEPFFTTKTGGRGTGLGLANVYAIVRHAGGEVIAESEPGAGTCFRVQLPLASAPVHRVRSEPHQSPIPGGDERILLVEDNDAVRNSTAKLLASLGYRVETARDGVEALARWEQLSVDMVLTDLAMPGIDGAELAERLRGRAPDLAIVFMSGVLDIEELRQQVEQGRARFLQKPVSLRELARVTREVLDAAHASRA